MDFPWYRREHRARPRRLGVRLSVPILALICATGIGAAEIRPGPQNAESGPWRAQSWLLPSPQSGLLMHAQVFRPPGPGPFPLVVVNHGSTQSAAQRARLPAPTFPGLTAWFVARGYAVVVPERPGHGATGGPYLEDQHGCDDADYARSGLRTADSIMSTVAFMTRQRFVRREGVVVVGQSAGGWGALALASRNPRGVRAVINFSGGRGGRVNNRPNHNCAPERLVEAAGRFGRTARLPTLWIYTANDSYFAPELSSRMAEAFRRAGGDVSYRLLPAFGADGHDLSTLPGGERIWQPVVDNFLDALR